MKAPLYSALCSYREENNILLHMPGHQGGRAFSPPELRAVAAIDFTEVDGLDDLHHPQGVLAEAQELAARAWGADRSFFLVNGATSGIHSLMLSLGKDAEVLVPRNMHRSLLGGMILSGVRPIFADCIQDPESGIALSVDPLEIKRRLDASSNIAGVFIESPTYYGTVSQIGKIAVMLNDRQVPLMVDGAHGGHFAFHPDLPKPALALGAKACVHGLHKNLPVMTQGGILHVQDDFPFLANVIAAYDLLTTTSPSYPLMASIDVGRAIMEEQGRALLENALEWSESCRSEINRIYGLRCRGKEFLGERGVAGYDPLKILIEIRGLDISGFELMSIMRKEYGIQLEMAGENHMLAMFSAFNTEEEWQALPLSLSDAVSGIASKGEATAMLTPVPPRTVLAITPREAFFSTQKTVMIKESTGLIAAEMVAAYPPGIPCLIPGEIISPEVVEYLEYLRRIKASVHGLQDPCLNLIRVVC